LSLLEYFYCVEFYGIILILLKNILSFSHIDNLLVRVNHRKLPLNFHCYSIQIRFVWQTKLLIMKYVFITTSFLKKCQITNIRKKFLRKYKFEITNYIIVLFKDS
jgi:hypothetical protein